MYKYPVAKPYVSKKEKKYVRDAVDSGWLSSKGPYVERFENAFADFQGQRHAVACSSGTSALTIALRAIGVKEGDEVIVPEFTMIATAYAVRYCGATPVFVDCGDDLNIDPYKIEEKITEKTKAIIPVHIYGRPAQMGLIMSVAKKYNLYVIEDAAEAHGAWVTTGRVGSIGHIGCFSLFANKIINAGEGGICVTDDESLAHEMRQMRSMDFDENHSFLHPRIAYNFRMTNLQAAVGLAQVERLPEILEKRADIRYWYNQRLRNYRIPFELGSVLWMYDVLTKHDNLKIIGGLKKRGVESRMFFKPMSMQPCLTPTNKVEDLKAYDFSKRGLYLPTYEQLKRKDVEKISNLFLDTIYEQEERT